MTKLNITTKKASHFIRAYDNSYCHSVVDFYKTCSSEKINIEHEIKEKMKNNGGFGYRILSGNSFNFTCGYILENSLIIETVANTFVIEGCRETE